MEIYKKMFEELITRDVSSILRYTGARTLNDSRIKLNFFKKEIIVDLRKKEIYYFKESAAGKKELIDTYTSSLILHYLLNADGTPLSGRWISFRELPGGLFYWQTIPGVLEPLVRKYEGNGSEFLKKTFEIGGEKYNQFKFASVIYPFKMFPVLMIFDEKSVEFEAGIRVLFDESASHYIKTDIIKLVVVYIVNKLCK